MSHPVLAALSTIDEALKGVADVNPTFMTAEDKAAGLLGLAAIEARTVELRLRLLADAADVAQTGGSRDAGVWLAGHARLRPETGRQDYKLAKALDRTWTGVATGMREGTVNLEQARLIVKALEALPDDTPAELLAQAEAQLVEYAKEFAPKPLARLGRRILEVIAPDVADEAEAKRLEAENAAARRATKLQMRRQGDGTTRIWGRIPDAEASRFATYLAAFANPRRHHHDHDGRPCDEIHEGPAEGVAPGSVAADPLSKLPYPRRLGEAFCQLLETLDPKRLPIHGGDATTVIVTITLDQLRTELATAGLLDGGLVPGDDNTGDAITAGELRRLACTANIIPAVLGGKSEVLDLGRSRRFHSPAQRKALLLRDRTCRAVGCDIPGTWAEAHHWIPWARGGKTDLKHGVLLCSHDHHRAHDPNYTAELLPNGDVRFTRRT